MSVAIPSRPNALSPHSEAFLPKMPSGENMRTRQTEEVKQLVSQDVSDAKIAAKRFLPDFDIQEKVIIVTGGGRGLGLTMAAALYQAGAIVHCLDRLDKPHDEFMEVQRRTPAELGGQLHFHSIDVRQTESLRSLIAGIADQYQRLDGLIAAAGIQQVTPAIDYEAEDAIKMLEVNYVGVFMTAQAVARQMLKYKTPGSLVLIASMSSVVANKGLRSTVYNSSKAAVAQLARNLAMEWGPDGIRVNALSPGHIITPMVEENFKQEPWLKEWWTKESMLGRVSKPEEFRGVGIFLLSNASSYMTGSNLVIDGGHTAW